MNQQIIAIGERRVTVFYGCGSAKAPLFICIWRADDLAQLAREWREGPAVLVAIDQVDWNRELSPWPGKRAFRGGPDFGRRGRCLFAGTD